MIYNNDTSMILNKFNNHKQIIHDIVDKTLKMKSLNDQNVSIHFYQRNGVKNSWKTVIKNKLFQQLSWYNILEIIYNEFAESLIYKSLLFIVKTNNT